MMYKIYKKSKEVTKFMKKYGSAISHFGFTQIPNILLRHSKNLGLKNSDLVFACELISRDFEGSYKCYAGYRRIAKESGKVYTTICSSAKRLIELGYLEVYQDAHAYDPRTKVKDFSGLMKKIRQYAKHLIEKKLIDGKISKEKQKELERLLGQIELEELDYPLN